MKDRSTAFVIGNGMSRRGIDLMSLKELGLLIGCNEIFREMDPDYLVALDIHLPHIEALTKLERRNYRLVARNKHRWLCLEGRPFYLQDNILDGRNNNSGIMAIWFAAHFLECKTIYLIGFDFFRPVPRGDPRFEVDGVRANDITNGTYQFGQAPYMADALERLMAQYPDTSITRVGEIYPWDAKFYQDSFTRLKFVDSLDT